MHCPSGNLSVAELTGSVEHCLIVLTIARIGLDRTDEQDEVRPILDGDVVYPVGQHIAWRTAEEQAEGGARKVLDARERQTVDRHQGQDPMLPARSERLADIRREIVRGENLFHVTAPLCDVAVIRNCRVRVQPIATPFGVVSLRPQDDADEAFLRPLFDSVKGSMFAPMLVDDRTKAQLLGMQYHAMTQAYRGSFPEGAFNIVESDGAPIGRLIIDMSEQFVHVVYLAFLPDWRRRGIGSALMGAVVRFADAHDLPTEATVALDNAASLRLWASLGFVEISRDATDMRLRRQPRSLS